MKTRRFLIFMSFLLIVTVLLWGIDGGWAQQAPKKKAPAQAQKLTNLNQAVEQAAAERAYYGYQRSVTNAQREAAAARAAARRAEAARASTVPPAGKGGTK